MSDVNPACPDDLKTCATCGDPKPPSEFYARYATCKACTRAKQAERDARPEKIARRKELDAANRAQRTASHREYMATHPDAQERQRASDMAAYHQLRAALLDHYGHQCACCGSENDISIDHIYGGGTEHCQGLGGNTSLYRWLVANDFPAGF